MRAPGEVATNSNQDQMAAAIAALIATTFVVYNNLVNYLFKNFTFNIL